MSLTLKAVALLAVGALTPLAPSVSAASALPDDSSHTYQPQFHFSRTTELINKTATQNQRGTVIGSCTITSNGGTCTISSGRTATRTIQVDLGLDRAGVAAKLGISSAASTTVTVGCSSPKMKSGQTWKAWSKGTRYGYRIKTTQYSEGLPVDTKTSRQLSAFNRYSSAIICGLG